jgi:hypothetical protein
MSELTQEFVQECLDRHPYGVDVSKLILDIAQGANAAEALLSRVSRSDIIEWLGYQIEILVDEPVKNPTQERASAEILLGYLEATKGEGSRGLYVEVERQGVEELGAGPEYYQVFDVTIRYEEAELAVMAPDSEGQFNEGKWVAHPVKWPPLLAGLVPLPELVSEEPEIEVEKDREDDYPKREQDLLREIERGALGGTLERIEERPTPMHRSVEPPATPDLFR